LNHFGLAPGYKPGIIELLPKNAKPTLFGPFNTNDIHAIDLEIKSFDKIGGWAIFAGG